MHTQYDLNEVATLSAFYLDDAGHPVDPSTIVLTITAPDGSTTVKTKVQLTDDPLTGRWSWEEQLTLAGVWSYEFVSTSPNLTQEEYLLVGAATDDGPCDDWIGPAEVFAYAPLSDIAESDRDYALAAATAEAATRILFVLSGRRFTGICKDTVRPCRRSSAWGTPGWWPGTWNDSWGLCACQSPSFRACGCSRLDEILLGGEPVLGIQSVKVDGAALASTAYRVDDDRWLVRIDGDGWPCCQDLTLADTELDTWSVTFFYGRPATADGVLAAERLAGELYQASVGGECQLPSRVSSLVRQGVQFTFLDPQEFLTEGRTGLYEVDIFLTTERWGQSHRQTVIASPDVLPQVRRTG